MHLAEGAGGHAVVDQPPGGAGDGLGVEVIDLGRRFERRDIVEEARGGRRQLGGDGLEEGGQPDGGGAELAGGQGDGLGWAWEPREVTPGLRPVMEIAGGVLSTAAGAVVSTRAMAGTLSCRARGRNASTRRFAAIVQSQPIALPLVTEPAWLLAARQTTS
ncbi:hypothetical protein [Streptomyces sp. NWU49]|uniref:hypothetical protein n=1 Tax=Streptomyces sp. NWU49 TaxID=2201153 RepID=UPI0015E7E7E9|nr:hypothetical protein [Streptomyces sp. NWU49]